MPSPQIFDKAVARAICHRLRGEIRKRYTEGQEDQLGSLGLVTNTVVLWNTMYMQAAIEHLTATGMKVSDEDIARLSPLQHEHINFLGHYSFILSWEINIRAHCVKYQEEGIIFP